LDAVGATTEEFVVDDVQAEAAIRKITAAADRKRVTPLFFSNRFAGGARVARRSRALVSTRRQLVFMIE
jgi:hypothetical protein